MWHAKARVQRIFTDSQRNALLSLAASDDASSHSCRAKQYEAVRSTFFRATLLLRNPPHFVSLAQLPALGDPTLDVLAPAAHVGEL